MPVSNIAVIGLGYVGLPLALALPEAYAITPVIVVTQTFVELVGMVIYVRLVPRMVSGQQAGAARS